MNEAPPFGPSGELVHARTYARTRPDGSLEDWGQTVQRVVDGNLALVYGDGSTWTTAVREERDRLFDHIYNMRILPAGRHLWATGVSGRQYLSNCFVAGAGTHPREHFEYTFSRLMEGGGVGSNYSFKYHAHYPQVEQDDLRLHFVCDPEHADHAAMRSEGLLSSTYGDGWTGAFMIQDSRQGWAEALVDLIDTFYRNDVRHVDRVYDLSVIRPAGAKLHTFGGTASGPAALARLMHRVVEILNHVGSTDGRLYPLDMMSIDHAIGECVVAGGVRRSARMSIVDWDDPDVFDFIRCKRDDSGAHWTTNISVGITDEFVEKWLAGDVRAARVMDDMTDGMVANGEPGFYNISTGSAGELRPVVCTNPCGEIPLEDWEQCTLGHVNLEAFAGTGKHRTPDMAGLVEAHKLMTRFLLRATFADKPDPRLAEVVDRNRRIGVGHFGVQGFLVKQAIRFSDAPNSLWFRDVLSELYTIVRNEARDYAFKLRIPEPIKVTTVAPTGSIAKLPGATEGIHPVYARYFERRIRFSRLRADHVATVEDYRSRGYTIESDLYSLDTDVVVIPTKERLVEEVERLGLAPSMVESADEIPLDRMLAFQSMYQQLWADNAVSFTINFPEGAVRSRALQDALRPHLRILKGTTLMPDGTRPQAPYTRLTEVEYLHALERVAGETGDSNDEDCTTGACPIR